VEGNDGDTQQEKLKIEREKVEDAKLEAQATMFKMMNESSKVAVAKIQDLDADMSTMDPLARGWYMMYHDHIGKEAMAAQVATWATPTPPVMEQPTVMGQPSVAEQPSMEEPGVMEVSSSITN
jgi:hypothetical protein